LAKRARERERERERGVYVSVYPFYVISRSTKDLREIERFSIDIYILVNS